MLTIPLAIVAASISAAAVYVAFGWRPPEPTRVKLLFLRDAALNWFGGRSSEGPCASRSDSGKKTVQRRPARRGAQLPLEMLRASSSSGARPLQRIAAVVLNTAPTRSSTQIEKATSAR